MFYLQVFKKLGKIKSNQFFLILCSEATQFFVVFVKNWLVKTTKKISKYLVVHYYSVFLIFVFVKNLIIFFNRKFIIFITKSVHRLKVYWLQNN